MDDMSESTTTADPEVTAPDEPTRGATDATATADEPARGATDATATADEPARGATDAAVVDPDEAEAEAHLMAEKTERTHFLEAVLDQVGTKHVVGAEADPDDPKPHSFDAAELVEWASSRAGVAVPDGTWNQYRQVRDEGEVMDVEEALRTEGAILFRFDDNPDTATEQPDGPAHVAISLGDGRVIEATADGHGIVRIADAGNRFTHAGDLPGLVGVENPATHSADFSLKLDRIALDQDRDRMHDATEAEYHGTKPGTNDTDNDGLSDLAEFQINALPDMRDRSSLDGDRDGLLDAAEIRLGTDPNNADSDGDGMDDHLEIMIGTDPNSIDSSIAAREEFGYGALPDNRLAEMGALAAREHLNYLRLEADPDDPRVPDVIRENFHLFGRAPELGSAEFDAWLENYERVQAGLSGLDEFDEGAETEASDSSEQPSAEQTSESATLGSSGIEEFDAFQDAPAPVAADPGFDEFEDEPAEEQAPGSVGEVAAVGAGPAPSVRLDADLVAAAPVEPVASTAAAEPIAADRFELLDGRLDAIEGDLLSAFDDLSPEPAPVDDGPPEPVAAAIAEPEPGDGFEGFDGSDG